MKAVVLIGVGDLDRLELREVPDPRPGAGTVRVKVAAASINPVDWKIRSGAFKMGQMEFPAILGRDVSGTVMEVGQGVTRLRAGDKVLGLVNGGYAEQVGAREDDLARLPEGLDLVDAAALPLVALTGAQLIEEATQPKRGETLLVTGAAGGVGRTAVYAARRIGARVIAGVRARQRREALSLGADEIAAIDDEQEIAALPQLDAIADTVGGETIARLLPKVRAGGTIGSVVGEPAAAKGRDVRVRAWMAHPDAKRLRELAEAAARGELKIPIEKRFPLAQAREAQKLAERGSVGKILLIP